MTAPLDLTALEAGETVNSDPAPTLPWKDKRGYTRWGFTWRDAAAADARLSHAAFRLCYLVSQRVQWQKGSASVDQKWLAAKLGVSDRTVRTLVTEARDRGYLDVLSGHGPGAKSEYRMRMPVPAQKRKHASGIRSDAPEPARPAPAADEVDEEIPF